MSNYPFSATATAHPNIALIKYWGDIDPELHIPSNGSISMNLAALVTRTTVSFNSSITQDMFILNGEAQKGESLERISKFLDHVRQRARLTTCALVESSNNFPSAAGIASSASGFAALSMAASRSAGLLLNERELSSLARLGSGSACRSIPGGFVEWQAGKNNQDSYAFSIAPPEYWDIADCIAVISDEEKTYHSSYGHTVAATSIYQPTRVTDAPNRLSRCRDAIKRHNFDILASVVMQDSNLMHAVMITSDPALFYWLPGTLAVLKSIIRWRKEGLPVCYSIDAGPNVHVLCPGYWAEKIEERLKKLPDVTQVITSHPGGAAAIIGTK